MSDNSKDLFEDLKGLMTEQLREAYMEGAHKGSVTTCAILYATMKAAGLEEEDLLFALLKDIAHQHGCDDLAAIADELQSKVAPTSNESLS